MLQNLVTNHGLLGHFGYGILIAIFGLSFGAGFERFWLLWGTAVGCAAIADVCVRIVCTCLLTSELYDSTIVIAAVYLGVCCASTLVAARLEDGDAEVPFY